MRVPVLASVVWACALLAACGEDTSGVGGTDGTVEEETTPSAGPVVLVAEPLVRAATGLGLERRHGWHSSRSPEIFI